MTKPVHVYRLVVQLPPEAADPHWWPDAALAYAQQAGWNTDTPFGWPARRLYLSRTAAHKRAKQLRSYGATVTVERSQAVVWGKQQQLPGTGSNV